MLALAAALGGCSVSGLLPEWSSPDYAGAEPAYRYIIANHIKEVIGEPKRAGSLEISGARKIDSFRGPSWMVCLREQKFPLLPRYYAVFLQRDRIVDSRISVVVDQCEIQSFAAYDWASESANAPLPGSQLR